MPTLKELTIITAVHEAGHAVISMMLGVPIENVCVKADANGVGGNCRYGSYIAGTEFEHILVCLAGQAAENILLGVDYPHAYVKDFEHANEFLAKWKAAPTPDLEPYRALAWCLVHIHERKVMELAKLLLQHGEITPQLVERLAHNHGIQ